MTATWGPPPGQADYGDGQGHGQAHSQAHSHGRGPAVAARAASPGPQPGLPASATCWLCGTQMPTAAMVADGGAACSDVRWYCQDAQQCTWRWTSSNR
jgi:hypothetical protein